MERRLYTSLKDDVYDKQRSSKKPSHDPHFRRKKLPSPNKQESTRREHSGFTNCSSENKSFRSSRGKQKETRNSVPTEAKSQASKNLPEPKSSESKLLHELRSLPTEVFLKLVLLKLDIMKIDGFSELSELAKFINKSKEVVAKSIPPQVETVVREMILNNTEMNQSNTPAIQPVNTQVSYCERERKVQLQGTDYSMMTELLNQAEREKPPYASATVASDQYASSNVASDQYASSNVASDQYASSNVASYQNLQSIPGFSHGQVNFPNPSTYTPSSNESFSYNTASSSMAVIPGLTLQEQTESHSAYNVYQSQNSYSSVLNYNNFKH